jgi:hypothetical protein
VVRAHLLITSAIAIFAALVGTDAFTIRLHVACVWCGAIAFTGRVPRNAFACAAIAFFAIFANLYAVVTMDASAKRTVWIARTNFVVTTYVTAAALIWTNAFTIRLHVANIRFGAIAFTNWITFVVQTLLIYLAFGVTAAFMGTFGRARLGIALLRLYESRTRIPTFSTRDHNCTGAASGSAITVCRTG